MFSRLSIFFFLALFAGGVFWFSQSVRAESFLIPSPPKTISFLWDGGEATVPPEMLHLWFHSTSTLRFRDGIRTEASSPTACPWSVFFCDFSFSEKTRYSIHSKTSFALDETLVRKFLDDLRLQTRKDPIDALFTAGENNTVSAFAESRDGTELDIESELTALKNALVSSDGKDISLPLSFTALKPKITSTDAETLGITGFLGEGRTNFSGSPKNRIFNIKRAIEQFQGVLIAPREEFSFVRQLGDVDGEHGYLPELVIKRGETLPEFGGGICQVSTTLFRAALNTGQKITERRNHAYPVSYYKPYGMDATVYIPKPDFRFRNNTEGHILIQVAIEEKELVFRLYGTPDGRTTSLDGPHITARTPDGGMKTVFTQKVTAADGTTFIEDSFKSSYESASKYPHPGEEKLTQKPKNWSEKQWSAYVTTGALPR